MTSILTGALFTATALGVAVYAFRSIRRMLSTGMAYVVFDVRRLLFSVEPSSRERDAGSFWFVLVVNIFFVIVASSFFVISLLVLVAEVLKVAAT